MQSMWQNVFSLWGIAALTLIVIFGRIWFKTNLLVALYALLVDSAIVCVILIVLLLIKFLWSVRNQKSDSRDAPVAWPRLGS